MSSALLEISPVTNPYHEALRSAQDFSRRTIDTLGLLDELREFQLVAVEKRAAPTPPLPEPQQTALSEAPAYPELLNLSASALKKTEEANARQNRNDEANEWQAERIAAALDVKRENMAKRARRFLTGLGFTATTDARTSALFMRPFGI